MALLKKTLGNPGIITMLVLVLLAGKVHPQSGKDLMINEVLVLNDSNYVDDYGQRSGWIEIFNSAYNTVNIAGMYLSNDPNDPKKYQIPTGDPLTKIPPRNYLVFFADNHTTRGILHLNFTLLESEHLLLYDVNGRDLIDRIVLGPQKPDVSYGRLKDGSSEFGFLEKTTPKANNYTGEVVTAGENFVKMDPYGIGMALIAMSVVFVALILLYLVFRNTKVIYGMNFRKLFARKEPVSVEAPVPVQEISGEVNAAIAMAMHLYINQLHDHEEAVLTIKKVARTYSPWSSKIYGLRNSPR